MYIYKKKSKEYVTRGEEKWGRLESNLRRICWWYGLHRHRRKRPELIRQYLDLISKRISVTISSFRSDKFIIIETMEFLREIDTVQISSRIGWRRERDHLRLFQSINPS